MRTRANQCEGQEVGGVGGLASLRRTRQRGQFLLLTIRCGLRNFAGGKEDKIGVCGSDLSRHEPRGPAGTDFRG